MIKIEAIIRVEKFEDVKDALSAAEVKGITLSQVMGCGAQKGYTKLVRGVEVDITMLSKIKLEIVVASDAVADKVIGAIQRAAYTGKPGDGKIFSYEIRTALRIRTKETGNSALE